MEQLFTYLNELYGFKIGFFEKITKGFLSENYILHSRATKYFLKQYRFDSREKIKEIHAAKKYFSEKEIPVILPLQTESKETFFFFNEKYFALFPFVSGRELERNSMTDIAVISLAEMQARIHLAGKGAHVPVTDKFKGWDKEKSIEKLEKILIEMGKIKELGEFDRCALKNIQIKKQFVSLNKRTFEDLNLPADHLIHGDFLEHNMFFGEDDKVSHVFDFEKTEFAPRMYELFRSIFYIFLSVNDVEYNFNKAKLYLDSYLKVYPVTRDELEKGFELFYLKMLHSTWVEGEHYLNSNTRVDHYLFDDSQRVKYLTENYREVKNKLLGF